MTCSKDAVYDQMLLFPMKESVSPHAPLWVKKNVHTHTLKITFVRWKNEIKLLKSKIFKKWPNWKNGQINFFLIRASLFLKWRT